MTNKLFLFIIHIQNFHLKKERDNPENPSAYDPKKVFKKKYRREKTLKFYSI